MGMMVQMARVELLGVDQVPSSAQAYVTDGELGTLVAALANVPELVGPVLEFVECALGAGSVGMRHKAVAILRASILQGGDCSVKTYTAASLEIGLTRAEVRALRGETPLDDVFRPSRNAR